MPRYDIPSPHPVEQPITHRYAPASGVGERTPATLFIEMDGGVRAAGSGLAYLELRFNTTPPRGASPGEQFVCYMNRAALRQLRDNISAALATHQPQPAPRPGPPSPPLSDVFCSYVTATLDDRAISPMIQDVYGSLMNSLLAAPANINITAPSPEP